MRFVVLSAALVLLLLAACNQTSATPNPGTQAAAIPALGAGSDEETSILEEAGNINLALHDAQNGRGPQIVGHPTAVYGKIMTYRDALEAIGSKVAHEGESQVWKFDRPVYLYLFEGDITDADPRTSHVTDWAQTVLIFDAETGSSFRGMTVREPGRLDVSQFLTLKIRDNTKGVPPRERTSLNRPPPIAVARATPAPKAPDETPTPTAAATATPSPRSTTTSCSEPEEIPRCPGVELAKLYPYTLYTHCGIRSAYFDGRRWIADPILSAGNVNPPPGWGNPSDKGTMELVAVDLARFTSTGGLVAEFRPLPEGAEYPWRPCY